MSKRAVVGVVAYIEAYIVKISQIFKTSRTFGLPCMKNKLT